MKTFKISYTSGYTGQRKTMVVDHAHNIPVKQLHMHLKDVVITEVTAPTVTIEPTDIIEHITLKGTEVKSTSFIMSEIIGTVKHNRAHGKDSLKYLNDTKKALLSYVSVFNVVGV
jgi:hypothetical protein